MNLFFWRKESHDQNSGYAPYEEIDAKRTSKLGYFFLILMVIFGVGQGESFLFQLKQSITLPEQNSYCLATLVQESKIDISGNTDSSYNYYSQFGYRGFGDETCVWSLREKELSIDILYEQVVPLHTEIASLGENITRINSQISQLERMKQTSISNYDVSLQEKMADVDNPVFDQYNLQTSIPSFDLQIDQYERELATVTARKELLNSNISKIVTPYASSLQQAYDIYAHDMAVYKFKQFLLSFVFIAPLFFFVWRFYSQAKLRRSEYTIIWGGVVATVGIIFAQILLVFVYEILPKEFIQEILKFFAAFEILWAVLYWFGFILVPLFFGFLIYLIQKKFYNKRAVMMRALKSEHCPNCSLKINRDMNYCPVCGYTLKAKCMTCGAMSMDGGSFCQDCGAKMGGASQ